VYRNSADRTRARRQRAAERLPTMCASCLLGHRKECEADWCTCICNEGLRDEDRIRRVIQAVRSNGRAVGWRVVDILDCAAKNKGTRTQDEIHFACLTKPRRQTLSSRQSARPAAASTHQTTDIQKDIKAVGEDFDASVGNSPLSLSTRVSYDGSICSPR
jgi:hypothetical protein